MRDLRYFFAFVLTFATLMPLLFFPLPWNEVSYMVDSSLDNPYKQILWHGTGLAMAVWFYAKTKSIDFFTLIACLLFGAFLPLIKFWDWVSFKIVPERV